MIKTEGAAVAMTRPAAFSEGERNMVGTDHDHLDRIRIKALLMLGLTASLMAAAGDFLLGFGEEVRGEGFSSNVMANAINLSDAQLIGGGLLGAVGLFLEGLACFAVYRLMADAAPKYARLYRAGIFVYLWLAPIGMHMNVGLINFVYKHLLLVDETLADGMGDQLLMAFSLPVWILFVALWLPMMIVQFLAFSKELTPYPSYAKWFSVPVGAIPVGMAGLVIGAGTALGSAIETMCLNVGNIFMFSGLLAALPDEKRFEAFREEQARRRQ